MLRRLVIHRFRGIREGVLEDLGKVNLLIGPNNSGKTAILELLYLGGTSGRPCELILENVPDGIFPATTSLSFDFLGMEPIVRLRRRHGLRDRWGSSTATLTEEGGLSITLYELPEGHPLREFRLGSPSEPGHKNRVFHKKDLDTVVLFTLERQEGIPSEMIPSWFVDQKVKSEDSRLHYLWQPEFVHRWNGKSSIDLVAVWAEEGKSPDADHVLFFDFHTVSVHFADSFANRAYREVPDWYERTAESLIRVFPSFEGAKVEIGDAPEGQKGKAGYVRFPGRTPLEIDQFGDGVRHAFKVLASLIALRATVDDHPGLFLWEDPELFMHPESLGRLLDEVVRLIQDRPIQVFISTQSLEVVALVTHHFRGRYRHLQEELRAFRLNFAEDYPYPASFQFQNLYAWLEQGMDPRYWGVVDLPLSYRYRKAEKVISEGDI